MKQQKLTYQIRLEAETPQQVSYGNLSSIKKIIKYAIKIIKGI